MNKEQFAEKIIRLRKKKGYTQAQLAELLNVSNKAVSRWETAEGYPDITLLKPLSEALGISCDELLGDTKGYSDLSRYDAALSSLWPDPACTASVLCVFKASDFSAAVLCGVSGHDGIQQCADDTAYG